MGVPGPAKSSSVWGGSMSLGRDAEAAEPAPVLSRHGLRPRPNIKAIETRFGAPRIANFALATDSALWRSTYGPHPDCP